MNRFTNCILIEKGPKFSEAVFTTVKRSGMCQVSMPEMDGVDATRQIKAEFASVRAIALSMLEDDQIANAMLQAGAEMFEQGLLLLLRTVKSPFTAWAGNEPVAWTLAGVTRKISATGIIYAAFPRLPTMSSADIILIT
jgi:hypothetical protein